MLNIDKKKKFKQRTYNSPSNALYILEKFKLEPLRHTLKLNVSIKKLFNKYLYFISGSI